MGRIAARNTSGRRAGRKGGDPPASPRGPRATGSRAAKIAGKSAKPLEKPLKAPRRRSDLPAAETVIATFAHDVRTPLTGILALSELLATSGLGERERRWVAAIKDAAEHIAELTTLVVEGARAGTGKLPAHRQTFDLRRFTAAIAASLAARAEAKNLACESHIAPDLPRYVRGDAARLRTALENLMANAVKFTERGKVGIAIAAVPLARGRLRLTFTVTDSGIGMTAAEMRRLFRPFAQASPDIARKFGGAGLGLVQVRRLARAMHGDLKLTSAPGRGSTFRLMVVVDRAEPESSETPALAAPDEGRRAPALHVLCVEDNPYGRVVLNAILTELGHRVDFVGSGESAVAAVKSGQYDVALMDVMLADLDGIEATRRIRAAAGPGARVPIIGVSARADRAEVALAAGMQAYLIKPVTPRMLADALARVSGRVGEPSP
jgi:two-component system, sensor histidine kinase